MNKCVIYLLVVPYEIFIHVLDCIHVGTFNNLLFGFHASIGEACPIRWLFPKLSDTHIFKQYRILPIIFGAEFKRMMI